MCVCAAQKAPTSPIGRCPFSIAEGAHRCLGCPCGSEGSPGLRGHRGQVREFSSEGRAFIMAVLLQGRMPINQRQYISHQQYISRQQYIYNQGYICVGCTLCAYDSGLHYISSLSCLTVFLLSPPGSFSATSQRATFLPPSYHLRLLGHRKHISGGDAEGGGGGSGRPHQIRILQLEPAGTEVVGRW